MNNHSINTAAALNCYFLIFIYLSIYLGNINLVLYSYIFIYIYFYMYIYTVKYSSRNMSNTHKLGEKDERSIRVKGQ